MAINSTDFTAEQLYKQQELLKQENYVLQNHQRPFVPMGTPLEYQGKGVPTMAPSTGKSMADWTTEEARNYALKWGAATVGLLGALPAGIGYAAGGAFGRPVMAAAAQKAAPNLGTYVSALKAAGGGGAGARASVEVIKNAKRLSESNAMENLKRLMTDNPALKGLEELAVEKGAKIAPLVDDYKWLVDRGKNILLKGNETEKWAAELIKKRFQ